MREGVVRVVVMHRPQQLMQGVLQHVVVLRFADARARLRALRLPSRRGKLLGVCRGCRDLSGVVRVILVLVSVSQT